MLVKKGEFYTTSMVTQSLIPHTPSHILLDVDLRNEVRESSLTTLYHQKNNNNKSKGSVSQLMDNLNLINSVEKVEAMVNSKQKGVENALRK